MKEIQNAFWDYVSISTALFFNVPLAIFYQATITRFLGSEKYGLFSLLIASLHLVFALGMNWTRASVIKFGKKEFVQKGHLRCTFYTRGCFVIGSLFLTFLALQVFKDSIVRILQVEEQLLYLLYALLIIFSLTDHLQWVLKALGLMKSYAISMAMRQMTLFLCVLTFIGGILSVHIQWIILFELVSYLLTFIYCIAVIPNNNYSGWDWDWMELKHIYLYSWPLIFLFLSGYLIQWIDVYVINYFLSLTDVGIYQAAYKVTQFISNSMLGITAVAFPLLMSFVARGKEGVIRDFYLIRWIPQMGCLAGMAGGVLIVLSSWIIQMLYGDAYLRSIIPFIILVPSLAYQFVSFFYSSLIFTFSSMKPVTVIHVSAGFIKLITDVVFVYYMGISGAAISTTLTFIISTSLLMWLANKRFGVRSFRPLIYPSMALLIMSVCLLIDSLLFKIFLSVAVCVIYVVDAKKRRIFSPKDLEILADIKMPNLVRRILFLSYRVMSPITEGER